jgi:hypothetical protein
MGKNMTSKPAKEKEFLKLKKKWDSILAKDGFKDIEHWLPDGNASNLFARGRASSEIAFAFDEERQKYYRLASIFLHDADWSSIRLNKCSSSMARSIWELWCEGLSGHKIADKLGRQAMIEYRKFLIMARKARKSTRKSPLRRKGALKVRWFERKIAAIEAEMLHFHKYDPNGQLFRSDF